MPNRRSTAEAFQILISHAFGDAGSPYLIGVVSLMNNSGKMQIISFDFFSRIFFSLSNLKWIYYFLPLDIRKPEESNARFRRKRSCTLSKHNWCGSSSSLIGQSMWCQNALNKWKKWIKWIKKCSLRHLQSKEDEIQFQSLQYALFVTCFIEILGGVFFLLTSIYILGDKKKVEEEVSGK